MGRTEGDLVLVALTAALVGAFVGAMYPLEKLGPRGRIIGFLAIIACVCAVYLQALLFLPTHAWLRTAIVLASLAWQIVDRLRRWRKARSTDG